MSLFAELRRRNVIRIGIAYVVLAWLMAQVAELLLDAFGAPDWVLKTLLALFLIGFPFAVFFAWAFELTPEGIKRERDVERGRSVTAQTGRKLDRAIIVVLLAALAWFAWDRYRAGQPEVVHPALPAGAVQEIAGAESVPNDQGIPVIAVLPFKAAGSDDGGFLAGGLHDDLLTRLAKLGAFQVISRTSMKEYGNTTKNMRQIGEELGAGYILEGGVQARGDRVRINAQLIDAPVDQHLWAEVYDRELTATNLFDIQAELAVAIAKALHATLSPEDRAIVEAVPTRNLEAYNAYLRGVQNTETRTFVGQRERDTVAAFEEAVRLDPEFALAWARLAIARIQMSQNSGDPELTRSALMALGKARALQPGLLEVELAWAEYQYRVLWEYEQALAVLDALGERAERSYDAVSLKAFLYRRLGRYADSYQAMQEATHMEPRMAGSWATLSGYATLVDDCGDAGRHAEKALSLAPDAADVRTMAARYELECNGNAERARNLLKDLRIQIPDSYVVAWNATLHLRDLEWALSLTEEPWFAGTLGSVFMSLNRAEAFRFLGGDEAAAQGALETAAEGLAEVERDDDLAASETYAAARAFYHGMRGDPDATLQWVAEHRRRFREEFKGDQATESENRLGYAQNLASAGLLEEAVSELQKLLEEPGGYRFPYVDGLPASDALEDHPRYRELRARYGETKASQIN